MFDNMMATAIENEWPRNFDSITAHSGDCAIADLRDLLNGPLAWAGSDLANSDAYIWQLSELDVEEIETALQSFKALGLTGDEVTRHNFALPKFSRRLEECSRTLHNGRGFFLLRGLDPSRYSVEDNVSIYLGISTYIADIRGVQDRKGNVLSHITNSKLWTVPLEKRHGIHSNKALPFHNDMGCDILALQARHSAHQGGYTYISSVSTVFKNLLLQEPEVAKTLVTPDWPVQISGARARHYFAPAFTIHEGRLMASMDPNRFGPHPSAGNTDIPSLTAEQRYALAKVSEVAQRSELRLSLKTGDLLFLNNWSLIHRRDAYVDDDKSSRHLVRLWLRNTRLGWAVPSPMLPPWLAAYGKSQTYNRTYNIMPLPEYIVPKYSAGSAAYLIEDSDESDEE